MKSDESIDLVVSEVVNAYGSVVAKEEHENPYKNFEEGENVDPPRFHSFINFFNWSLPPLVNRTKGQLKFHVRAGGGACARKSGRGCCPCKAANKNCNVNCQCRWRSCYEVTKLKIIKRSAVRYFSIFLTKMFYLYLQSSSASRQPKISNLIFFANTVHRVRRDPSVKLRKLSPNNTGHGLRITKRPAVWCFSIFLFEKYQFLLEIFYLH